MDSLERLYPFQRDGVARLLGSQWVLLADEMGLGKTVQALAAMRELLRAGAIRRVLVVAPACLLYNWIREIRVWVPDVGAIMYRGDDRHGLLESDIPIVVASYEIISRDWQDHEIGESAFFETGFDLIVADEAQNLKNRQSIRARVLSSALVPRRWALSGTPMENHPRELTSVLHFLLQNEFSEDEPPEDYQLLLAMRDRVMLRRTKAEVLPQLPAKRIVQTWVELTGAQREEYERIAGEMLSIVNGSAGAAGGQILGLLQRLRRVCSIGEDSEESSKLDLLDEEIETVVDSGNKVVVFSSMPQVFLTHAARRLERFAPRCYWGGMSLEERESASRAFQSDPDARVLLASLRAGGVGHTWTQARYVYHTDLWWNPQAMRQAEDRVHRIGQRHDVVVKQLVAVGTIEEQIVALTERKEKVFELIVGAMNGETTISDSRARELVSQLLL